MSNALAVATVTQALALLIARELPPEIDFAVSVQTRKPPTEPPNEPTITVFCYQVTPDVALRNTQLPTRMSDGTLVNRPVSALDLHFLISAYGEQQELVGQRLIGSVVRTLHEIPILPKDVIEEAQLKPYLRGSDLSESAQLVRFTPTVMDVDETSKLWGMFHQTPFVLSAVYQAVLVLIEGRERPEGSAPVLQRRVQVEPMPEPDPDPEPAPQPEADVEPEVMVEAEEGAEPEHEEEPDREHIVPGMKPVPEERTQTPPDPVPESERAPVVAEQETTRA